MSVEETRLRIMRAAERLIAAEGIDAVSLRKVSVAAGQRNTSATQYHFDDKRGLVEAVLWRHSEPIQRRWTQTLDILEGEAVSVDSLVQLMVRPLAEKLRDPDGGWEYIVLCTQLLAHPTIPLIETRAATTEASRRLIGRLLSLVAIPDDFVLLKMLRVSAMMYPSIRTYGELERKGVELVSHEAFVADLVDDIVRTITYSASEASDQSTR